jgi:alpha-tubulin suppressor-like RCC1 family protein
MLMEDIACGSNFTAALAVDGKVFTWGGNDKGNLGLDDVKDRVLPTLCTDLVGTDVVKVVCGDYHMFACTKNEVYGWGWNGCGQLGINNEEDQHRPVLLEVLRNNQIVSMSCGAAHTVAVVFMSKFKTRLLYAWGSNANGQLGQGKKKRVLKPTPVPDLKDIVISEVACGSMHTVIRTEEGEVYTTGLNRYGQLGHGNNANLDSFKLVEALKGKSARSLCCGGENTQVLTARAWVEDKEAKECMSCKQAFTFVIRKHHCRNCGGIFCSTCSAKKIAILKYGLTEPVRVCTSCYHKLGGR